MIWVLLLLACGADSGDSGTAYTGACDRSPPLSWDSFGQGFMSTHCAGCHSSLYPEGMREGAPVGVDLDTYTGVLQWVDRVEARTLGEGATMPPGGGPSDAERALLAEWLACGVWPDHEQLYGEEP